MTHIAKITLTSTMLAAAIAAWLPAAAGAQTVLRYTDHEPLGGMRTTFIKDVFFAAVEKESNGRLKIQDHWDSSVATGYDALKIISSGKKADIGIVVPEYSAKELPLHQIFKSFPVGPTGARQVSFFRRVYDEVPSYPAELRQNNVVNVMFTTGYPVAFFTAKPLSSLDAIKGDKWRTASFWHTDFLRHAGAVPVSMPWGPQVFNAMKDRTLDGLVVNIDSGYMLKVHEVAPYVLASKDLWLGHVYLLAMNADTWDRLAPDDKAAIRRAAETSYKSLGAVMDQSFDAMVKEMRDAGVTARLLDDGEVRAFETAVKYQDVQAAWVKTEAAKGTRDVGITMEQTRAILKDALN